jgi:isoaspartyl peptidase/L-asparaginase-like protein (Ntn-hydrolase superfamily)
MALFTALATWPFGQVAVEAAIPLLLNGRPALDAAIAGAQAVEDDPTVHSVGYGGMPNSVGSVQLDACVMDGRTLACGSVAGLENVRHAAALARLVMERTPHLFLVGEGARLFALQNGFPLEDLLTPEALADWLSRRAGQKPAVPPVTADAFDTVTVLTLDQQGHLAGACSTSGLPHKLPGRVGDSPILGAGLYVDDEAGAAGATGEGEEILRVGGSLLIAEALRAGRSPQEACVLAVQRVLAVAARRGVAPARVAFLALDRQGRIGAACTLGTDFKYAVGTGEECHLLQAIELRS